MAASCWRFSCDGCGGCHRCYLDDMATGYLYCFTCNTIWWLSINTSLGSLCCLGNLYDCVTMEQLVKEANLRLALKREKYGVVIPPNIQEKAPMAKEMKLGAGAQVIVIELGLFHSQKVAPADEPHHH